uniref:Uncharacterized protein n=1 Tax=Zea mays TaxID=4577 RepID=A0A804PCK2_MAIZE
MGFSPRVDGITDGAAHNILFLTGIPSNSQGALKRTARALSYGMEAGVPWRLLPLLGVLEGGLLFFPAREGFPAHEQRGREVPWLPPRASAKGTAPCAQGRKGSLLLTPWRRGGVGQRKKKGLGAMERGAEVLHELGCSSFAGAMGVAGEQGADWGRSQRELAASSSKGNGGLSGGDCWRARGREVSSATPWRRGARLQGKKTRAREKKLLVAAEKG